MWYKVSASQYVEFRKLADSLLDLCSVCDILKPYIELSVALQGLSVPCWKIVHWWDRLKEHTEEIKDKFSFKNVSSHLPMLKKYVTDITAGAFKNTKLVQGWLIVSSETKEVDGKMVTMDNWEMRGPSDVEKDVKGFMSDLQSSFEGRVASSSKPLVDILTCLDLDNITKLLCGKRLKTGKIKLDLGEGELEKYGVDNFCNFFTYVCSLPHIQRLKDAEGNEESLFDPALANTVFHKFKQGLRQFLCKDDGEHLASWFNLTPTLEPGCLDELQISNEDDAFSLTNRYAVTMRNIDEPFHASLNEDAVYKSIFTDRMLYEAIGMEACICVDIALAKGGTEAVVESYYSVMASNKMPGGQNNETLTLRLVLTCFSHFI